MGAIHESDLDELNEEERTVVETVARFAEEVMRPVGIRLDRLADPEQVCAPDSELFEVFRQYRKLGVDGVSLATSELPPARRALVQAMIHEAMGWGDAGLAVGLDVSEFPRMLALLSGNPDLIQQFGNPEVIGCWPITEPDHGSDFLLYRN
ncbi:MAG: hypothetical protein KatS3mg008_2197 [Acidimicrobiales bacterium]|nr:MAG: hypothetical protein KatS3mg008_2197 [Acidimicrobiales bacterium]